MRWSDYYFTPLLICIAGFAFFTRFWRLHIPQDYVFDEVYHAVTVELISQNDIRAFEWWHELDDTSTAIDWLHPPVAKYIQSLGVEAFGFNSFGWRVMSALFGVGVVILCGLIGAHIASAKVGILAALLASLDGLLLVQSRIAMNDIFVTFFVLLSFLIYKKFQFERTLKHTATLGVVVGLAIATKWNGVFALAGFGIFLTRDIFKSNDTFPKKSIALLKTGSLFVATAVATYIVSYAPVIATSGFDQLTALHKKIWQYQMTLTEFHAYASTPTQWFFNNKPVWYAVDRTQIPTAHIFAQGNPILQLIGAALVLITAAYILKALLFKSKMSANIIDIFVIYSLLWTPWVFSPRPIFYYHYTAASAFLCILIALLLEKVPSRYKRVTQFCVLFAIFTAFIVWFPNWTLLAPSPVQKAAYKLSGQAI